MTTAPAPGARILFEDTHLIVLSKPAGLLSQGDVSEEENLVDHLRVYFGRNYVGLIHRLDRNTSGVMVVAKRSKSAQRLTDALQAGTLKRAYLAIVHGVIEREQTWSHHLLKDSVRNETRVVREGTAGAKAARLRVSPVETRAGLTLARFELETGRSHQIRVQSSAEGHALVGDVKYLKRPDAIDRELGRPALHSTWIEFPHPMSHETMAFDDPLPRDLSQLWNQHS